MPRSASAGFPDKRRRANSHAALLLDQESRGRTQEHATEHDKCPNGNALHQVHAPSSLPFPVVSHQEPSCHQGRARLCGYPGDASQFGSQSVWAPSATTSCRNAIARTEVKSTVSRASFEDHRIGFPSTRRVSANPHNLAVMIQSAPRAGTGLATPVLVNQIADPDSQFAFLSYPGKKCVHDDARQILSRAQRRSGASPKTSQPMRFRSRITQPRPEQSGARVLSRFHAADVPD
jgi:hypothetical protein